MKTTKQILEEFDERYKRLTKDNTETIRMCVEKALDEQQQDIINEIAQYSGINDIQTKELIKIIKEL